MSEQIRRYAISSLQSNTLPDSHSSVYASAPFKFLVGGEPFYIHRELVSLHSEPLGRMINGHMAEAKKGLATLEDVNGDTYVRFIERAHKGHYAAATVEIESPTTSTVQDRDEVTTVTQDAFDTWRSETSFKPRYKEVWSNVKSADSASGKRKKLKEAFISRKYTARSGLPFPP